MKYIKIRIEVGTANSTFDIYYDTVSSGTIALLYDTGLPAVGLTNEILETGEGVTVSVPDGTTSIIISSDPKAFCTEIGQLNDEYYTIPIGCMSYTVSANNGIFNYFYTDCDCNEVVDTIDATYGYTEKTFCALQDSVNAGILSVTYNGYCTQVTPTPTSTNMATPTPTNMATPTPTNSPTVEYYYYVVTKYDCNNSCAVVPPALVGRSSVPLSTVDGMYRLIGSYTYVVTNLITPSPPIFDVDLDTATNTSLDCSTACNPTFYYSYTTRLAENSISEVCIQPNTVVFSDSPTWNVGMVLYSTATPPTILSGYRYVNPLVEGNIYNLNIGTGVVGIDTGSDC